MCKTESPEDFWRFSVLFLKAVDPRYVAWEGRVERLGAPCRSFESTIHDALVRRMKHWGKKRKKTLFGTKAPESMFVVPA